ncbi:2'-5' RNA ligase family protein [Lentzea albidocapillata]|uniref:2'-5' RNA ligase family protein n=1 Tax=Lentzea albidocapillata TaxID=40571 RepID=UPI003B8483C6
MPRPWLHVTMQGVGFVDEVSTADTTAISESVRRRLAGVPWQVVKFHRLTARQQAIALCPTPTSAVCSIRDAVREGISDVWGVCQVPERSESYSPHLTVAYVNTPMSSVPVVKLMETVDPSPVEIAIRSVSLIRLRRVERSYTWDGAEQFNLGSNGSG